MKYFPVLAYHKISPEKEIGLTTIRPQVFEQQLQIILESGFTPITFTQLVSGLPVPEKPIILSFDDGYESIYRYALPVLEKYKIKAVVYVLAGYIGEINSWEAFPVQRKQRHLDKNQIREMSDMDIEIGSHGLSHSYLPVLELPELRSELITSRKVVEDITGRNIVSFCYPYGIANNTIRNEIQDCGYQYAVGNIRMHSLNNMNPGHVGRRSIYSSDSEKIFRQKLIMPQFYHISLLAEKLIRFGAFPGIFYKILSNNSI
jgi:peptidoglycan/xylan/chitin deacetylase (PgdA/CDA1 family)